MHEWQSAWDTFGSESAEPARVRDVEGARLKSLEGHIAQLQEREGRLTSELRALDEILGAIDIEARRREGAEHDAAFVTREQELENIEARIRDGRTGLDAMNVRIEEQRGRKQKSTARLASLRVLQSAAF